jgi:8-amino-7-oxononanoate synthase
MLIDALEKELSHLDESGLRRILRVAEGPTNIRQRITDRAGVTKEHLLFCSNDYLGLASHSKVKEALKEGVDRWGGGSGASHLISGHTRAHVDLEEKLSALYEPFIGMNRCLTFSTGFMANLAVMTALGGEDAELFSDQLNHASLIDGMRLAKGNVSRFKHKDYVSLENALSRSTAKKKIIVSDGVFSMDGDLCDGSQLLRLTEKYDAFVIIDDAHGFGTIGDTGLGTIEYQNIQSNRVILIGTLSKAAGLSGAFVIAPRLVIDYLEQVARSYIYTTASVPALSYALLASIDIICGDEGVLLRKKLHKIGEKLFEGLVSIKSNQSNLGWWVPKTMTPIQPVVLGDAASTMRLSIGLENLGFRVPGIRPPTVPQGASRLRITLSAAHEDSDVDQLLDAMRQLV